MKQSICASPILAALLASTMLLPDHPAQQVQSLLESPFAVDMKSMELDGQTIAYREAGDPSNPTVLLLHGFPTSSHMFRELIPVLGRRLSRHRSRLSWLWGVGHAVC